MLLKGIFSRITANLSRVVPWALIVIILLLAFNYYELRENFAELSKSYKEQDRKLSLLSMSGRSDYTSIIPDSMIFWGSKVVKLDHPWIKMAFNQILSDILSNKLATTDVLRRLAFFKPGLIDVFDTYGIHHDALYVLAAESGAYHLAVSKAKRYLKNGGAVGGWQWLYSTALDFNVPITKDIDMRRNVWYMAEPFCNYILELRAITGSIEAALRSYNCGSEKYMKAAKQQNWVKNPWFVDVNSENNYYLVYNLVWKFLYENTAKCGLEFKEDNWFCYPTVNIQVRLAKNTELKFIDLARLIRRDAFELEILNSGHISTTNGFRSIEAERNRNYTTYPLRLPANIDPNALQAANASQGKPAAIKGVTFFVNHLINKDKKE